MHITDPSQFHQLPDGVRQKVEATFEMAKKASDLGLTFIMSYSIDGDVGTVGNLRAGDPVERMMGDLCETLNRERNVKVRFVFSTHN